VSVAITGIVIAAFCCLLVVAGVAVLPVTL
jgi:hypothetical protein